MLISGEKVLMITEKNVHKNKKVEKFNFAANEITKREKQEPQMGYSRREAVSELCLLLNAMSDGSFTV